MTQPEPVCTEPPPLPGPVVSTQWWRHVTFLHWAVEPSSVAPFLPPGTRPDILDGRTFVGLVLFRIEAATLGRGPAVPWLGTFLETNVRLYSVDGTGRRGVVFLSLDAERALVVPAARALVGVPYRWAQMRLARDGDLIRYDARLRRPGKRPRSVLVVRAGPDRAATTRDAFLTARWGAHVGRRKGTRYVPTQHAPWPLREAAVLDLDDELVASVGLPGVTERPPDHAVFSEGVYAELGRPVDARLPR